MFAGGITELVIDESKKPDYLELDPNGGVPLNVHDGTSIFESGSNRCRMPCHDRRMRRRWMEGVIIVVAALVCVATSRPRWSLEAALLPEDVTRSRVIEIEASEEARVTTAAPPGTLDGEFGGVRALGTQAWPGRNRFLISAGRPVSSVRIGGGPCKGSKGGCGGGPCEPPPDAKVTMLSSAPVETWRVETRSAAQTTEVPPKTQLTFRVPVTHSHPIHVHVEPWKANTVAFVQLDGDTAVVTLGNFDDQTSAVAWSIAADSEELCADPKVACKPPQGATLGLGAAGEPTRVSY